MSSANVIPFPTRLRSHSQSLAAGDAGVKQTIQAMQRIAVGNEGAVHPALRALAITIVRGAPARDDYAQAVAVFEWVKQNIEFRGEYDELLQTPLVTAQFRAGDCDDQATLVAALLRALGIQAQFVTVATDPADPERQFSHVFTSAYIRDRQGWLPLDTTVDRSYPGWYPERITRVRAWGKRGLGDGEQNNFVAPASGKVQDATAVIQAGASAVRDVITAFRSNGAGAFDIRRTPGGVAGNVGVGGVSTTTMLIGAAGLMGLAFLVSGRGRR